MENERMSDRELIECARACGGDGGCKSCAFDSYDWCSEALLMALADRLDELTDDKWVEVTVAKPLEADEYLVMIRGAKKPTVLHYDPEEEAFYEEDNELEPVYYPVTHWAMMPEFGNPSTANAVRPPFDKGGKVRRCATCRHEDKLAECDRCVECEKHNLWEERT